jgi:hypothetical protein
MVEGNSSLGSEWKKAVSSICSKKQDHVSSPNQALQYNDILSPLLPTEIWRLIFELVDWPTFLALHLVSKTTQRMIQNIRGGSILLGYLQSVVTEELPTFATLKTLRWRRSPDDLSFMKVGIPSIEKALEDASKFKDPKPVFVPMLSARELRRIFFRLKKKRSYSNTGVSFRETIDRFVVYYLEQTDQFAIVKISTTRSGAMGLHDTRLQVEDFYSIGDIAEILVPVRCYHVEFKQQEIFFSFLKATKEPLTMSAVNTTN